MEPDPYLPTALDVDQCAALLRRNSRGRVALSINALPAIVPVCYGVVGPEIILCAGLAAPFSSAMSDTVVALEVDEFDPVTGTGWSVLVRGLAQEASRPDAATRGAVGAPWTATERPPLVSLSIDLIAGHRLPEWEIGDETLRRDLF